jgi:hypothetical protein
VSLVLPLFSRSRDHPYSKSLSQTTTHYIANFAYERREEDDDKKKKKEEEKSYKKNKHYKKKAYGEAHINKECDSDDESSDSDSDDVATVAINGSSSSSKSLFLNLNKGKHTCLMAKESKKVKSKSSPPKYVLVMMN